jgi:hypothetical protein
MWQECVAEEVLHLIVDRKQRGAAYIMVDRNQCRAVTGRGQGKIQPPRAQPQ